MSTYGKKNSNSNRSLWEQVKKYSSGDSKDRIRAVELIYNKHNELPSECKQIIHTLANSSQPSEVRLAVAKHFAKSSPPTVGEYFSLLKALSDKADGELFTIINAEVTKLTAPSEMLKKMKLHLGDPITNPVTLPSMTDQIVSQSGKNFSLALDSVTNLQQAIFQNLLSQTTSYYSITELTPPTKPPHFVRLSRANVLVQRLKDCGPGRMNWSNYEEVCTDILNYCLVPPLAPPLAQNETKDGMHRRDIVYNIPQNVKEFWNYILYKYGMAIIVECKNYAEPLKENEVIISSKYLGKEKLTKLGLLLTRKGLHATGKKAQENAWIKEEKMMVCLDDEQLMRMLELKENNDEPSKIIDAGIRNFLASLS